MEPQHQHHQQKQQQQQQVKSFNEMNDDTINNPFQISTTKSDSSEMYDRSSDIPDRRLELESKEVLQILLQSPLNPNLRRNVTMADVYRIMKEWSDLVVDSTGISSERGIYAAQRAKEILMALEANYDNAHTQTSSSSSSKKNIVLIPSAISYNLVLRAYAHVKTTDHNKGKAASAAQELLNRMIHRWETKKWNHNNRAAGLLPPEPTTASFNSVISAWAKSGLRDAGKMAETAYTSMERWRYDRIIDIIHQQKQKNHTMDEHQLWINAARTVTVAPNAISLASVLDAWANSDTNAAHHRATAILTHMLEKRAQLSTMHTPNSDADTLSEQPWMCENGIVAVKPNIVVFNSVIDACAKSRLGREGALLAEQVLGMLEQYAEDNGGWNHDFDFDGDDRKNAGRTKSFGSGRLKPNSRTLSLIMEAWSQSIDVFNETKAPTSKRNHEQHDSVEIMKQTAQRCEDILHQMESLYDSGVDARPNVVSYTTAISAWSKCATYMDDASDRAEAILLRMVDALEDHSDVLPNAASFNAVITAFARSGKIKKAETTLQRAIKLQEYLHNREGSAISKNNIPQLFDTISYNAVLDAHAKNGGRESAERAQELLQYMESSDNPNIRPDVFSFNCAIQAQVGNDSHSVEIALDMLKRSGQPNAITYTSCMNVAARSNDEDQVYKAYNIFKLMWNEYHERQNARVKPDAHALSAFLNVCAYAPPSSMNTYKKRKNIIDTALKIFNTFRSLAPTYGHPNQFSYGSLFKACIRVFDHSRDGEASKHKFLLEREKTKHNDTMNSIFAMCCEDGFVSSYILNLFIRHASAEARQRVLGHGPAVPKGWCRKVPFQHRPHSR